MELRDFRFSFYIQSFFFLCAFFIFPACAFFYLGYFEYGVGFEVKNGDVYFIIISVILFFLGFLSVDLLRLNVPKRKVNINRFKPSITSNTFLYVIITVYCCYIVYEIITTDPTEIYKVRKGEVESNLVSFFIYNVMDAVKFSIIIFLLILGRTKTLFYFLLFIVFSLIVLSSGRLNLLLNIMLIFCIITNFKSYVVSTLMFVSLFLLLPFILSLKIIIYKWSVNGVMDLSYFFQGIDLNSYLTNFGHPLFSYLNVDNLIQDIGFRYFWDYIQGFLFYFKLLGVDFGLSITYFNTEKLLGVRESIVPPGYFAFGYVQLGLLGVFFSGALYRFMGSLGMFLYQRLFITQNRAAEVYISFICANSFYYGDVRIFVMNIFFPFLFCYFIYRFVLNEVDNNSWV